MTKSINKQWFVLLAALLVSAMSVGVGIAQQGGGTISGSVTDSQGAAISGAAVEVKSVATNAVFSAVTNTSGFYTAPSLAVAEYEVAAQFEGFKRAVRSGITLQVNQTARIDIVLEIGEVVETIEVVGEAPLVQSDTSTLGEVIERRRMVELPINGRGALALTLLTAGVVSNAGPLNSGFGDRGIQISSLSINGSPNSMNAQMLDGNNNILSYVGEVGVPPAVDSVEEFKVQSGTMSAEFGFTAGGTINLVTRSGTNQIHGTAYEFLRNDKLDARNTFSSTKLPLRYNQFGASVGGPIIKDRTFGFFNWEEYRLNQSRPSIRNVPTAAWRAGDFSDLRTSSGALVPIFDPATTRANPDGGGLIRDQFPNNAIPRERFDPVSTNILAFWPEPNQAPSNSFTQQNNFLFSGPRTVKWSQWNFKIDHRFSDSNSMFFRYTQARHRPFGSDIFTDPTVGRTRNDDQTNRNAIISDTHTFSPTFINHLRIGVMRQLFDFVAVSANLDWPERLGLPPIVPQTQFPQVRLGRFGIIGGQALGRRGSFNWDIQNMTTKIAGNHTIKIGVNYRDLFGANRQGGALSGDYRFQRVGNLQGLTTNPQGTAGTGDDLAQFLLGAVTQSSIDSILGNSWDGYALSFFLQDDWKVSQRLTLNLGFRYDYQSKTFERHNGHINFDPNCTLPNGLRGCTAYAGVDGQPRSFMDEDYNDFGPRFGFAYDLTGVRLLSAPELHDVIALATSRPGSFGKDTVKVPMVMQLMDPAYVDREVAEFLRAFGQASRDEMPKKGPSSSLQAMLLMNSKVVLDRVLAEGNSRVEQLVKARHTDRVLVAQLHEDRTGREMATDELESTLDRFLVEKIYLATLARQPTEPEREVAMAALRPDPKRGAQNLQWALINSPEFVFNY